MKTLLKVLGKLDVAQNVLSAMLGELVKISIAPCMDESFFISVANDDESSDNFEENIMTIIIHTKDGEAESYHAAAYSDLNKYDYEKIGSALASALNVFEKTRR